MQFPRMMNMKYFSTGFYSEYIVNGISAETQGKSLMEQHPEQFSECARLEIRKHIHTTYSKTGYDYYGLVLEVLDLHPSDDLLDLGCGMGDFIFRIRSKGHFGRLVGIDRSPDVVKRARTIADEMEIGADFRIGSAEHLEFPASHFDCITALHVISNSDPRQVISEAGRLLKADGKMVVATNSRMSYPILQNLKDMARQRFGWFYTTEWTEGFESEIASDILRSYFGSVEDFRYEDALEYPDAEVLVDLFRSNRGLWGKEITEAEWDRIVDWVREQALEIIPEHGYAEDPRSFSIFKCSKPLGM